MEQTINERVRIFIKRKGMSVNAFSEEIGVSQGTLNPQVNGTYGVSVITLSAIAERYPDANMRWFLTGKGEMEVSTITQNNTQGNNVVGDVSNSTVGVDTLLDIIRKLQEENASLIKMLSNKA
jgi:transcriptional regulator with XRE-family HTH domain